MAPLLALAGAAVFGVQLAILGWIMRLDFLAMVAGFAWPFALLLGLLMAILLIGALAGWPLMWATVGVEGTDAFDALSRSYAYTYQRPLRLLWYVLLAAILAAVSMFIVKLFATSAISLGNWSVSWGLDEETYRADRVAAAGTSGVERQRPIAATSRPTATSCRDGPALRPSKSRPNELSGTQVAGGQGDSLLEIAARGARGRLSGRLPVCRGGRRLSAAAQRHRRRGNGRSLRRRRAGLRHAAAGRRSRDRRARSAVRSGRVAGEHVDRLD